jgi:hypothetical protein
MRTASLAGFVAALALVATGAAQGRSLLTAHCKPVTKTTCSVVIPIAGGLPQQSFTVIFPSAGYYLEESGGSPVGKAAWELGPPAADPSDYRDGDTEYVSQISADTTDPPGSKAIVTFAKAAVPTPSATPIGAKGSFSGTCGTGCSLSFTLAANGTSLSDLLLQPPACLSSPLSSDGTLPVVAGSFNISINVNNGAAHITVEGKMVGPTKATATLSATCAGKTTSRTVALTKR